MPFDPTTAQPIPFDPATAKPVEDNDVGLAGQIVPALTEAVTSAPSMLDPFSSTANLANAGYQAITGSPIPQSVMNYIPGNSASDLLQKMAASQGFDPSKVPAKTPSERATRQAIEYGVYGLAGGEGIIPKALSAGVGALSGAAGSGATDINFDAFGHHIAVPDQAKPLANILASGAVGLGGMAAVHPLMPEAPINTLADIAAGEAPPNTREPSYGPKPPATSEVAPSPEVTTPSPPLNPSEVVPKAKPQASNPFDQFDAATAKPVNDNANGPEPLPKFDRSKMTITGAPRTAEDISASRAGDMHYSQWLIDKLRDAPQDSPERSELEQELAAVQSHMASENPTELPRSGGEGIGEPPEKPPVEPPASGGGEGEFTPSIPTADNPKPMFKWIRGQEDELYRLSGQNEADRTEGLKYISALSDPIKDPVLQEKLYHRAEDPNYPLSPDEEAIYDRYLGPIRDEATAAINRIRGAGYNVNSDGYIHRIVQGKGSMYDPAEGPTQTDPFGPSSLGRKTPSMLNRTMFKAVRDDGTGEIVNGNYKPGQEYTFDDGTKGVIRQATTREIEEATPLRYYKNAIANSLDNLLRLRRVERNINYLDSLKDDLQKNGLAYPPRTRSAGNNGGPPLDENTPPSDYKTVDLPQLAGWQIHPRIAKMLDNFYGKPPQDPINKVLTPINRALVKSIFINPIASAFGHGANVAAHWFVGRGLDNFMPHTWAKSATNMFRAIDDVRNLSPLYQKIQREGGALLYAPTLNRDFHQSMIKLMGSDINKHPNTWGEIARQAGVVPKDIVNALSQFSSKGLWFLNDIFVMGRVRDLMDKGMSQGRAVKTVGEEIPTYHIPTESWDGKGGALFSDVMRNPNIFMFGRYRYNMLQAIAHSFRNTLSKNVPIGDRAQAAGQLLSIAALSMITTAAANYIRKASGNDQAYIRKFGPLAALDTAESGYRLLSGQKNENYEDKNLDSAMSALFELAPGTKAVGQLLPGINRDSFTGKPILNYQGKPRDIAEQLGVYGAEQFSPIQQAESILKGSKDVKSTVSSMFGVNFPTPRQVSSRQYFQNKDNADFNKTWNKKAKQLGLDKLNHVFGGD